METVLGNYKLIELQKSFEKALNKINDPKDFCLIDKDRKYMYLL
jgi:hypothetical protein